MGDPVVYVNPFAFIVEFLMWGLAIQLTAHAWGVILGAPVRWIEAALFTTARS